MVRIVPRMVFWDLLKTCLISLTALTGIMVLCGLMGRFGGPGMDPSRTLQLIPLLVPPTLPYTLPICLLLATTLVYGRMSSNVEIVALKSAGVSMSRILWPAVLLAGLVMTIGLIAADQIIPHCHRRIADLILKDVQANLLAYLSQTNAICEREFPYEIYVDGVRGDRLVRPVFKHRNHKGEHDMVVYAELAQLYVHLPESEQEEPIVVLRLLDGMATSPKGGSIRFRDRTERMPLPNAYRRRDFKIETQSLLGCWIRHQEQDDYASRRHLAMLEQTALFALSGSTPDLTLTIAESALNVQHYHRTSQRALTEIFMRVSHATVAFPFLLLGMPISIMSRRRDFLTSFFICFMPIVLLYYPLILFGFNMSKEGVVHPALTMIGPSLLLLVLSIRPLRQVWQY